MLNKKALAASVSAPPAVFVEDVFSTFLYSGTGASQTITNEIDLAGEGGLVWTKPRNNAFEYHHLVDTVRGGNKTLWSNDTSGESTSANYITSFNSNGFTLGTSSGMNGSGLSMCSWTFREQPKFFDVVTYTGNDTVDRQIAHNLGSQPGMVIVKAVDGTSDWNVRHIGAGTSGFKLNTTQAGDNIWNAYNTDVTSSIFTVSRTNTTYDSYNTNRNGVQYVAYLFAHNAGGFGTAGTDNVISCGTFTSGASVTSVTLGYEPQYVLIKRSDDVGTWIVFDTMRGYTVQGQPDNYLSPNNSDAEVTGSNYGGPTATGFDWYPSGTQTYIYMAIRRPMKVPTVGTSVYNAISRSGTSANATISNVGFAPDFVISKASAVGTGYTPAAFTKLMGAKRFLFTGSTAAEATDNTSLTSFDQNGISIGNDSTNFGVINETGSVFINWFFKRASGFMDAVCFSGTGSATTFSHNLGVVPELMIVKRRNFAESWFVYNQTIGNTKYTLLNYDLGVYTDSTFWNSTSPTATVFSLGTNTAVNNSADTYVAYLFATCAGVSKVGSYTGNGSNQTINCGFTAGARFVLIKRTDSTGDWYVWDTARGIISGNDPYLLLNSTAAEVTSTDYIDPVSSGFEISSTAPAAINANGGSFIFMAIA